MFKTDAKGNLEERARLYNEYGNPIKSTVLFSKIGTDTKPKIHRRKGTSVNTKDLKEAFFNDEIRYAGKVARYYSEINRINNSKNLIKNVGKRGPVHFFSSWEKKHLIAFIHGMIKCKSKESKEIFNKMTKVQLMDLASKLALA